MYVVVPQNGKLNDFIKIDDWLNRPFHHFSELEVPSYVVVPQNGKLNDFIKIDDWLNRSLKG